MVLIATMTPVAPPPVAADPLPDPNPWYSQEVLQDAPLARYRLGESSGATAVDSAGDPAQDGTYHPTAASLQADSALALDDDTAMAATGAAVAMTASGAGLPTGDAPRTLEIWARHPAEDTTNGRWLIRYGQNSGGRFGIYKVNETELGVYFGGGSRLFQLPWRLDDGEWHHYAASWSPTDQGSGGTAGGDLRLFVDGALIGERAIAFDPTTTVPGDGLVVGHMAGDYDEVAVYDTALSPERIAAHFTRGASVAGEGDLVCREAPEGPYSEMVSGQAAVYLRLGEYVDRGEAPIPDERTAFDHAGDETSCVNAAYRPASEPVDGALAGDVDGGVGAADGWQVLHSGAGLPGGSAPRTVEGWMRHGVTATTNDRFLFRYGRHDSWSGTFGLRKDGASSLRVFYGSGQHTAFAVPQGMDDGAWHHYAVTYDGDWVRLFFDGAVIGSVQVGAADTVVPGDGFRVGQVEAEFDEVAVYASALSASEISQHFALAQSEEACRGPVSGGYGGEVAADDPEVYLGSGELTGADGRVAFDRSGNCVNGAFGANSTAQGTDAQVTDPSDGAFTTPGGWGLLGSGAGLPAGDAPRTVETWFRDSGTSGHVDQMLVQYGDRFGVRRDHGSELLVYYGPSSWREFATPVPINDGEWHHVAVSWAPHEEGPEGTPGGVVTLFLDGAVIATLDVAADIDTKVPASGLRVGENPGDYDEVAVYATALSPERVAAHWTRGASAAAALCPAPSASGHAQAVLDDDPVTYLRLGEHADRGAPPTPDARTALDHASCVNGAFSTGSSSVTGALADDDDGAIAGTGGWQVIQSGHNLPDGDASRTVAVWMRHGTTATPNNRDLVRYGGTGSQFRIRKDNATEIRVFYGGSHHGFAVPDMYDDAWHHYAVTYDGDELSLYVDGLLEGTHTVAAPLSTVTPGTGLRVGEVEAELDELAIYDRALSAAEIEAYVEAAESTETTTALSVDLEGAWTVADDLEFTATVTAGDDNAANLEGDVVLYDGLTPVGSPVALDDGVAVFSGVNLDDGNHSLTAHYLGEPGYVPSRSLSIDKIVTLANATTTDLVIEPSPAVSGQPVTLTATVGSVDPEEEEIPQGFVVFFVDDAPSLPVLLDDGVATLEIDDGWTVGTRDVRVVYGGDPAFTFAGSQSATEEHLTEKAAATITPDFFAEVSYGQPIEVDIAVTATAPGVGEPSGDVTVLVDDDPQEPVSLEDGEATVLVPAQDLGEHTIEVTYDGDSEFAAAGPTGGTVDVVAVLTETALSSSEPQVAVDGSVTLTATVSVIGPSLATPAGSVAFLSDETPIPGAGAVTLDGEGVASVDVDAADLGVGLHTIEAVYTPESGFEASAAEPIDLRVRYASETTLATDLVESVFGQEVELTATVDPVAPGTVLPTGPVTFFADAVELGHADLEGGEAVLETTDIPFPADGTVALTARYDGDGTYDTSVTETALDHDVLAAESAITVTQNPAVAGTGRVITVTAQLAAQAPGSGTPGGFVTFTGDGLAPGGVIRPVSPTGRASTTVTYQDPGAYQVDVAYGGDPHGRFEPSVGDHDILIEPATTLTLTVDPDTGTSTYGQPVVLSATVISTTPGLGTPAGIIRFHDGNTELAAVDTDGGAASFTVPSPAVGDHDYHATFESDGWAPSDTGTPEPHEVTAAATALTLSTSHPTGAALGDEITFTATIEPSDEALVMPGVEIAFTDGSTALGEATTDAEGVATLSVDDLTVGAHDIDAAFAGAGSFAGSADGLTQTVTRAAVTLTVEPSVEPAAIGADVTVTATVAPANDDLPTPTGDVVFTVDGAPLPAEALTDGTAEITTDFATADDHEITVDYEGDTNYLAAEEEIELTVGAAVDLDVSPPLADTEIGDPATFEVDVTPTDPGITTAPTGQVALYLDDVQLAVATLTTAGDTGSASLVPAQMLAGSHDLEVRYLPAAASGFGTGFQTTDHTVTEGTTTIAVFPASTISGDDDDLVVSAVVTPSAPTVVGPTGHVEFFHTHDSVTVSLGDDFEVDPRTGIARVTLDHLDLDLGEHQFSAEYLDASDPNYEGSESDEVEHLVVGALDATFEAPTVPLDPDEDWLVVDEGASFTVEANGVSTNPAGTTYTFELGDGTEVADDEVTHAYTEPGLYTIVLRAEYDHGPGIQRASRSARIAVVADDPLEPAEIVDRVITEGESVTFDASSSAPRFGIDDFEWDFGDESSGGTGARVTHTYEEAGEFEVTLDVTAGSEVQSRTAMVRVFSADSGVQITAQDASGPLSGVSVSLFDPARGRYDLTTDGSGVATFHGIPAGTWTVLAHGAGYTPTETTVAVSALGQGAATVQLTAGAIGVADVNVRRLSLPEILAAGIDINDPANQVVERFEANIAYKGGVIPVVSHVNDDGRLVGGGGGGPQVHAQSQKVGDQNFVFWFVLPGQVSYLSEFFEVSVVVANSASASYRFEEGVATLQLPPGLSLAPTAAPQSLSIPMPSIAGGSYATKRWVVRGDAAGTHTLGVTYNGKLEPLGHGVTLSADADVRVWGGDATTLTISVDDKTTIKGKQHFPFTATVTLQNTSDIALYNVTLALEDDLEDAFLFQPRQQMTYQRPVLYSGQSITAELIGIPRYGGTYDPERTFASAPSGGTPPTITSRAAANPDSVPQLMDAVSNPDDGQADNPDGAVQLSWEPVPGAVEYQVFYTDSITQPFEADDLLLTTAGANPPTSTIDFDEDPDSDKVYAIRTVLADGSARMYHNALRAQAGRPEPPEREEMGDPEGGDEVEDPVTIAIGNWTKEATDLTWPSSIYGMEWSRFYNSLDTDTGHLGTGWTTAYAQRLQLEGEDVLLVEPDGRRALFTARQVGEETVYDRPDELIGALTRDGDQWILTYESGEIWEFDDDGFLTAMSDGQGQDVIVTWDAEDRLESVVHRSGGAPSGYGLTVSYPPEGPTGLIAAVTTTDGREVVYQQNADGALVEVDGPGPGSEQYTVDDQRRVIAHRDASGGQTIQVSYSDTGRVDQLISANGDVINFDYDVAGRNATVTNTHSGDVAVYRWDENYNSLGITDPLGNDISREHNDDSRLESTQTRRGAFTAREFDANQNLLSSTDHYGASMTRTYDDLNRVTSVTDPSGATTTYTYQGTSRVPIEVSGPDGSSSMESADGLLTRQVDPDGVAYDFTYDDARNLTSITNVDAGTTTFTYDAAGRPLTITAPGNRTTSYSYDEAGRLVEVVDANGLRASTSYDNAGRVSTATDPNGGVTSYTYNDAGQLLTATDPQGRVITNTYDASGDLIRTEAPGGAITTYTYGALGRLLEAAAPGGETATYEYDADGNVTVATSGGTAQRETTHDLLGRVTSESDPLGASVNTTYDASGRPLTTTDPLGRTTTYTYDSAGRVLTETDPAGAVTTRTYTPGGRLESVTDPLGNTTSYEYDQAGRATTVTDALGGVTTTTYDAAGDVASVETAGGLVTTFTYDNAGRQLTRTTGGSTWATTYTPTGKVASHTEPGGAQTGYEYDSLDRVVAVIDPNGGTTTYAYDERGNRVSRRDAAGGLHTWAYDAGDRLVSSTDPLGATTSFAYDDLGRLVSTTDPTGRIRHTTYDAAGRVVADRWTHDGGLLFSDSFDGVAETAFDAHDPIVDTTGGGWEGEWELDGEGSAVPQAEGEMATFDSGSADGVLTLQRPETPGGFSAGAVARMVDDETFLFIGLQVTTDERMLLARVSLLDSGSPIALLDQVEPLEYPVGGGSLSIRLDGPEVSIIDDTNGLAITHTLSEADMALLGDATRHGVRSQGCFPFLPNGCHEGDPEANMLDGVTFHSLGASDTVTYGYDAAGQRTRMTDWRGNTSYSYDLAGRLAGVDLPDGEQVDYQYDLAGNRTDTSYTGTWGAMGPGEFTQHVDFDALGRVERSGSFSFDWDPDGRLLAQNIDSASGPHPVRTYGYDEMGRIESLHEHLDPVLPLAGERSWEATYDAGGNVASLTETIEGQGASVTEYGYDAAGQMLSATSSGAVALPPDGDLATCAASAPGGAHQAWRYSPTGTRELAVNGEHTTASAYNVANQLVTESLDCGDPITYQYDASGRRTSIDMPGGDVGDVAQEYDAQGRLARTTTQGPDGAITYDRRYTGDGQLHEIVVTEPGEDPVVHDYLWDPASAGPAQLLRLGVDGIDAQVLQGPMAALPDGASGPQGALPVTAGISIFRYDIFGSVFDAPDGALWGITSPIDAEDLVRAQDYDPWGRPIVDPMADPNASQPSIGYRGELTLGDAIHLRNRDYDSRTGTFLTPDPLDGVDGTTVVANLYHYANNNPVNLTDPLGLRPSDPNPALEQCIEFSARDNTEYLFFFEGATYGNQYIAANSCGHVVCVSDTWGACGAKEVGHVIAEVAEFILTLLPGYDCYQTIVDFSWGSAAFCAVDAIPIAGKFDEGAQVIVRVSDEMVGHADEVNDVATGARRVVGAVCSFAGETPVLMADGGTKPISEVEVGDEVLASDPETGESGPREVIATLPHTDQLLTLRTSSGDVVTTEDHRYWNVTDQQWQESQDLDAGDRLLSAGGDVVTVEGLDWSTVRTDTAYDLAVDELHTFYVAAGDEGVLVHNCDLTGSIGKIADQLGYTERQIRDAIHAAKRDLPPGAQRNPDVLVDLDSGEIYPELPSGEAAEDSIGNIFDYLPED